jgi:hypothetical protein
MSRDLILFLLDMLGELNAAEIEYATAAQYRITRAQIARDIRKLRGTI